MASKRKLYAPKRPKKQVKKQGRRLLKRKKRVKLSGFFTRFLMVSGFWAFTIGMVALLWFTHDLPSVDSLKSPSRKANITVMTEQGTVLATYGDLYEDMVTVEQMPKSMVQALLAVEDRRFYSHFGIDFLGIARAAYANYKAQRIVQGGSSITQQLAKDFLITQGLFKANDRSLRRKVQEALMSLWLEWNFTKDQILTIYLNRVYLGSGTYGVDAASRKYFNKSARNLTTYECAVLAGLLKAPSRYSPHASTKRAHERALVVLKAMEEEGFIKSAKSYEKNRLLKLNEQSLDYSNGSRYFANWVNDQVRNYVSTKTKDLIVVTTFDEELQKHAEAAVHEILDKHGKEMKVKQSAFLVMKPDGAIVAMVGGRSYRESQFNRAVGRRLAGSAFKIIIFLAGLENGWHPNDQLEDSEITIGKWSPKNYKWKTRGLLTLEEVAAYSNNAATIRLLMAVGIKKVHEMARRLGITTKLPNNLTIALGTADVSLVELTSVYATIINRGHSVWPYAIVEIRDKQGNILYQREQQTGHKVLQDRELAYIHQMLEATTRYGYCRAARNGGQPVAGKTGSNGDTDAWTLTYIPGYAIGSWYGNDDNKPMHKRSTGGRLPARTVGLFIKKAFAGKKLGSFDNWIPKYKEEQYFDEGWGVSSVNQQVTSSVPPTDGAGQTSTKHSNVSRYPVAAPAEAKQGLQSLVEKALGGG